MTFPAALACTWPCIKQPTVTLSLVVGMQNDDDDDDGGTAEQATQHHCD
jgi:hypothetical protein